MLHDLVPDATQVRALCALVMLQHSRRNARKRDGHLVTLAEQDPSLWHHDEIRTGLQLVTSLEPAEGYAEVLRLQALIAAEHARMHTAGKTDWDRIASLYATLEALTGSAIVRLNRAVALSEAQGPQTGLALLAELDDILDDSHRLAAVRGELAHRSGDIELARASYRTALGLCTNEVERAHLRERLTEVEALGDRQVEP